MTSVKPTFKCLTNTPAEHPASRSVPIKPKFSKLTLSSSNKKLQQHQLQQAPPAAQELATDKPLTPTPKMLSFSPEITDDEDEEPAVVNKILASSPSAASSVAAASALPAPPVAPPVANPCEGPSFSQQLQLNDTDITNCTELNNRRSSILPPSSLLLSAAPQPNLPELVAPRLEQAVAAYNETLSQMERLELTASSSEDLFAPGTGSAEPVITAHQVPSETEMPAASSMPATGQRRQTVYTISSSSSSSCSRSPSERSTHQRSTRSSLASAEVYDVISLSDSESERSEQQPQPEVVEEEVGEQVLQEVLEEVPELIPDRPAAVIIANPSGSEEPPADQSMADDQPDTMVSLPSLVQDRLDNFFDNIPLLSSEETVQNASGEANASGQSSLSSTPAKQVAADGSVVVSRDSSVYVSETDEEAVAATPDASLREPEAVAQPQLNDSAPATAPQSSEPVVSAPQSPEPMASAPQSSEPVAAASVAPTNSELVASSRPASQISQRTPRKAATTSHRTPTISIAASIQIRIQVSHDETTSSESSEATTDSQNSSQPPPQSAATTGSRSVDEQAAKMADMQIGDNGPRSNQATEKVQTPAAKEPRPNTRTPSSSQRRPLQLDKLRTPKVAACPAAAAAVAPESPPTRDCDQAAEAGAVEQDANDDAAAAAPVDFRQPLPPPEVEHTPAKAKIVLDDAAQKLLNELYGASWQTPDLMRKCVIRRPVQSATAVKAPKTLPTAAGGSAGKKGRGGGQQQRQRVNAERQATKEASPRFSRDFSLFRKDIASHLDSTRIGEAVPSQTATNPVVVAAAAAAAVDDAQPCSPPVVASPFFQKPRPAKPNVAPNEPSPAICTTPMGPPPPANNRRSSMGAIKSARKKAPNRLLDSETESESDDNDNDNTPEAAPQMTETPSLTLTGRSMRRCRLNATKPVSTRTKIAGLSSSTSSADDSDKENDDSSSADEWRIDGAGSKNTSKASKNSSSGRSSTGSRRRKAPAKANPDLELTYLDLTSVEVVEDEGHQQPDASAEDLEQIGRKLLADFEFQKRAYQPQSPAVAEADAEVAVAAAEPQTPSEPVVFATPTATAVRTKRKLFNPYFEDLEQAAKEICSPHDITPQNIDLPRQASLDEQQALVDDPRLRVKIRGNLLPKFLQNPRLGDLKRAELPAPLPLQPQAQAASSDAERTPAAGKKPRGTAKTATPKTPANWADVQHTPEGKYSFLSSLDVHISKHLLHPMALMFRERFKTKREQLTAILMELFTERLFAGSENKLQVPVTWNKKLLTTAGLCINRRRAGCRTASIELSEKVITSADRLRCTLIHELCHAATWVYQGENGHGVTWRRWAAKANALLPELPTIERCHAYDIEYKYLYQCTLCGAKSPAHSRSKKVELIRCAYCHGAIEIFLNRRDKDGQLCPQPVRKATGFAAFVKCEYRTHKLAGVTHAEVMRLLSARYAQLSDAEKKQY